MRRVILCDDHGIVLEGLKSLLSTVPGLELTAVATSGEQLLALVGDRAIDLAIIDIEMGRLQMDGVTLARRLKQTFPRCKVMALTFHQEPDIIRSFLATGAEGYLLKDEPPATLLRALERILGGHRYVSADLSGLLVDLSQKSGSGPVPRTELTPQETEVLRLFRQGKINKQIAADLGVSIKTVEKHRAHLMRKSGCRTAGELGVWALRYHP